MIEHEAAEPIGASEPIRPSSSLSRPHRSPPPPVTSASGSPPGFAIASSPIRSPPVCCCRKPIVAGQDWQEVSNGDTNARARFHRTCHAEWRTEREAAARQALGLEG